MKHKYARLGLKMHAAPFPVIISTEEETVSNSSPAGSLQMVPCGSL